MVTYPTDNIHREVTFIAFHLHWSRCDILSLEHAQRVRYVKEINRINARLSEG
ncbi:MULTISPECIES: DUF6760 family protein [unclassified Streptomyces]|uniref:DUF6760 family protein n=1 Tax=unclassified Streptomyces TaxID=2593676 RepID=UPI002D1E404B|nr:MULTISPECIES: DUF6760 family protein [unclassified Streptomyces]